MAKRKGLTLVEIYNSVPTIPYEGDDAPIHTDEHPYCSDFTCPCGGPEAYYAELAKRYPPDDDTAFGNPEREAAQERNVTRRIDEDWW